MDGYYDAGNVSIPFRGLGFFRPEEAAFYLLPVNT